MSKDISNLEREMEEIIEDNSQNISEELAENIEQVEMLDEFTALKNELEKVTQEAKKNQELYIRALAETENLRKRTQREKDDYIKYSTLAVIKKLLPIIDNLERAIVISKTSNDYEALVKGIEMTLSNMNDVIKGEGVEVIDALGKPFNPELHQPLMVDETGEYTEETVIEELQKGYLLHGRLIRPSLVKVGK